MLLSIDRISYSATKLTGSLVPIRVFLPQFHIKLAQPPGGLHIERALAQLLDGDLPLTCHCFVIQQRLEPRRILYRLAQVEQ
jgi:hypothetical protein